MGGYTHRGVQCAGIGPSEMSNLFLEHEKIEAGRMTRLSVVRGAPPGRIFPVA